MHPSQFFSQKNSSSHASFSHSYSNTLAEIFSTDGGRRVFEHFGFEVGRRYVSPFRADARGKNFSIFTDPRGRVFFKDFAAADDHSSGNFLTLLALYGYRDFAAQITFAAELYRLELHGTEYATFSESPQPPLTRGGKTHDSLRGGGFGGLPQGIIPNGLPQKQSQQSNTTDSHSSFRVTNVQTDDFSDEELSTLAALSGGFITRDVLQAAGARALRRYEFEGTAKSGRTYAGAHNPRFTLVVPSANGNLYGYCYSNAAAHSTFPNAAKNFHLKINPYANNSSAVKFSLGLDDLRPNEAAYIVEGIKDVLILRAAGLNAFTLGGVQTRLPDAVRERLRTNGNSLVIVFDTDYAGFHSAKKLQASLNNSLNDARTNGGGAETFACAIATSIATLPKLEQQHSASEPKPALNDLADYVVRFGFDDELRAALTTPALVRMGNIHHMVTIPAIDIHIRKHLAESEHTLAALSTLIENHQRLYLYAPTGCGKTFTVLRHIAAQRLREGKRTIITQPTIALVQQIEHEYRDLNPVCITGEDNALTLLEARTRTCITVCTYDALRKVLYGTHLHGDKDAGAHSLLDEDDVLLVVDEAHVMTQEYHFRQGVMISLMRDMSHAAERGHRVLCLSGTPNVLFHHTANTELGAYTYCAVRASEQMPIVAAAVQYAERKRAAVDALLWARANHPSGSVVLRLNSVKTLRLIKTMLLREGVPPDDVDIICAGERDRSPEYHAITTQSRITRPIILVTSLLDCGVNILNTNIHTLLVFDERDPAAIVQFANRFRALEQCTLLLYYKEASKKNTQKNTHHEQFQFPFARRPIDFDQMFVRRLADADDWTYLYPNMRGLDRPTPLLVGTQTFMLSANSFVIRDPHDKRWHTNIVGIAASVEQSYRATLSHEGLMNAIERYGIRVLPLEDVLAFGKSSNFEDSHDETSQNETSQDEISHDEIVQNDSAQRLKEFTAHRCSQTTLDAVAEEQRACEREHERLTLTMLAEARTLFFETLVFCSDDRTLRKAAERHHLLAGCSREQSCESRQLATQHKELFRSPIPERYGKRYVLLRDRAFTHEQAITLIERFRDARLWADFITTHATLQRIHLPSVGVQRDELLDPVALENTERDLKMRQAVFHVVRRGCEFHGVHGERHIPNAVHRLSDLTPCLKPFVSAAWGVSAKRAVAFVKAMFMVEYVREREIISDEKHNNKQIMGGYYRFATDERTGVPRLQTLATFLDGCGINGEAYCEQFAEQILRTRTGVLQTHQQTQHSTDNGAYSGAEKNLEG